MRTIATVLLAVLLFVAVAVAQDAPGNAGVPEATVAPAPEANPPVVVADTVVPAAKPKAMPAEPVKALAQPDYVTRDETERHVAASRPKGAPSATAKPHRHHARRHTAPQMPRTLYVQAKEVYVSAKQHTHKALWSCMSWLQSQINSLKSTDRRHERKFARLDGRIRKLEQSRGNVGASAPSTKSSASAASPTIIQRVSVDPKLERKLKQASQDAQDAKKYAETAKAAATQSAKSAGKAKTSETNAAKSATDASTSADDAEASANRGRPSVVIAVFLALLALIGLLWHWWSGRHRLCTRCGHAYHRFDRVCSEYDNGCRCVDPGVLRERTEEPIAVLPPDPGYGRRIPTPEFDLGVGPRETATPARTDEEERPDEIEIIGERDQGAPTGGLADLATTLDEGVGRRSDPGYDEDDIDIPAFLRRRDPAEPVATSAAPPPPAVVDGEDTEAAPPIVVEPPPSALVDLDITLVPEQSTEESAPDDSELEIVLEHEGAGEETATSAAPPTARARGPKRWQRGVAPQPAGDSGEPTA